MSEPSAKAVVLEPSIEERRASRSTRAEFLLDDFAVAADLMSAHRALGDISAGQGAVVAVMLRHG